MGFLDSYRKKIEMPSQNDALPGRRDAIPTALKHFVSGQPLKGPWPEGMKQVMFGMGCFWGAERLFWQVRGVYVTAVGYAGGITPNPTYEETCTGLTGHAEVVLVVYDPNVVSLGELLSLFWEEHDPTQGMRQGNDIGTTYRSVIYTFDQADREIVEKSRGAYQDALAARGLGPVTTEIADAPTFYYAEDYHQQYLAKNPNGYCGLRGTGVSCPIPAAS
ncbi:peptide-methionine (S)-S-oxide reductase [Ochrobactrum quorumnocens]|uniref:Peptide methionine sulfoxide reductase MsrA n=1 Tax=Ochrobactrum quorumnocens TaxID=271865 RepID=A0A248UIT2_9HYPH|nr:peptide-methionine (S)-S-oxide reductase MsrA [[Ochrobactrum] quorumnocens]ASV86578.1 peptide-methionine (S)-S-oxide reductase [[Ochrobactrum] quorumnocens]KAA9367996.1 peptide-methionine (S)-S-oxide reductase MsrA [[Ochrobactrum] quorumnocens]